MYFDKSQGNEKLGKQVVVVNRPVGDTCNPKCPLLNFGCYAEKTENRFPTSRLVGLRNLGATVEEILEVIEFAVEKEKDIRGHERGDFLLDGKIDRHYLTSWKQAVRKAVTLPWIWFYTHSYSKMIADLHGGKVVMYASVHSEDDVKKAKAKGFKLFAWQINDKKKKGGSRDYAAKVNLPVIGNTLVCPEQRLPATSVVGASKAKVT
jgi:hypothetical protein